MCYEYVLLSGQHMQLKVIYLIPETGKILIRSSERWIGSADKPLSF